MHDSQREFLLVQSAILVLIGSFVGAFGLPALLVYPYNIIR